MSNVMMQHGRNERSLNGNIHFHTTRGLLVPFTAISLI